MKTRQLIVLAIALAFAVAVERLALGKPPADAPWWAHVPGFFALFGFFVCLALAFLSNALGKYWLQRDERYYHRGETRDD
ncbi:MAG: hypothetical protein ACXWX7_00605 [Candidatus Binatia bacterium]